MTITTVGTQAGGATVDSAASATRAFGSNVAAGNLVVVMCWKDSGNAFVVGDCTKSAGTATLGTIALDIQIRFDTGSSNFVSVGLWSAIVTGAGSCTMAVAAAAGTFFGIATDELNSTVGWDSARLEATNTGSSATDVSVSATTNNGTSAGNAAFFGVLNLPGSGTNNITPDAAFTQIFEQEDDSLHQAGSAIRRIVSAGTTDAGDWTIAPLAVNVGYAAALAVYREASADTLMGQAVT